MKKIFLIFPVTLGLLWIGHCALAEVSEEELRAMREEMQKLTQTVQTLSHKVESQQERIQELEQANQELKTQVAQPQISPAAPAPVGPPPPSAPVYGPFPAAPPSYGGSPGPVWTGAFKQGLQAFNPEIGVVADVVASLSESTEDTEGNDRISLRELELIFGHDIDPYARFDSTITLSDFEDPDIEEAYITYWGLPFELKGRIGRMRPKIGKQGAIHRDMLETVDEPLVVQEYFGVESLFKTGLEMGWFIPAPWEVVTHELTFGVMEGGAGEGGTAFGETKKRLTYYAHLKNFWDISDVTNLELGGTYLLGSSDEDSDYEVNVFGVDLTLIHYVDPIHRLKWQTEFYFQDRDEPFINPEDLAAGGIIPTDFEHHPWGFYSLVDYHLLQRWSIGGRFDYVIPTDIDPAIDDEDWAISGYLTFHQSEFGRWRLQYEHIEFADGNDDERVFVQGTFAIGVHKHQLQ